MIGGSVIIQKIQQLLDAAAIPLNIFEELQHIYIQMCMIRFHMYANAQSPNATQTIISQISFNYRFIFSHNELKILAARSHLNRYEKNEFPFDSIC